MRNTKFLLVAVLFACSFTSKSQTADEIIQKHLTAVGGADNWKKVSSLKMICSVNAMGTEIPITITTVNKKASRMDMTFNGMACYTILTNTEGWGYFPIQGQTKPEAMTAEQVKESQDELDVQDKLIDYAAKGYKVAYLGKDDVEGTDCHKLKLTYPDGKEETMFIDASNFYRIRSTTKAKIDGKDVEGTLNYGNFQKLPEGIVFPMSMDMGMGNMTIKTVEINKPIDESIFRLPAADAKK